MSVRAVHPPKAYDPIVVTDAGMGADSICVLPENADWRISVTVFGIAYDVEASPSGYIRRVVLFALNRTLFKEDSEELSADTVKDESCAHPWNVPTGTAVIPLPILTAVIVLRLTVVLLSSVRIPAEREEIAPLPEMVRTLSENP